MNLVETLLSWATLLFEIGLCGLVFTREAYRILPFFAIFAYSALGGTICVWLTYIRFGFDYPPSYFAYWTSTFLFVITRSLVIAELCRYGLRNYRGIWALVWRLLAALSALLVAHAAADAWGQPNGIAIYGTVLSRDIALASIVVLVALFLIRDYYGLELDPLQRLIGVGMCVTCAADVIGTSILKNLFTGYLFSWFLASQRSLWPAMEPQVRRAEDLWSAAHLCFFMLAMGIWCYALRKPVVASSASPMLLPARIYREMSPAINMRLATVNSRLVELLKP